MSDTVKVVSYGQSKKREHGKCRTAQVVIDGCTYHLNKQANGTWTDSAGRVHALS